MTGFDLDGALGCLIMAAMALCLLTGLGFTVWIWRLALGW